MVHIVLTLCPSSSNNENVVTRYSAVTCCGDELLFLFCSLLPQQCLANVILGRVKVLAT